MLTEILTEFGRSGTGTGTGTGSGTGTGTEKPLSGPACLESITG